MYKISLIIGCFLAVLCAFAEQTAVAQKNPKQRFDWRKAEGERRKMREKFYAEQQKHIAVLRELHRRYAAAKTEAEKNNIRTEINDFLTEDFNRKIEHSKKRIKDMKKFVARLEEEQKKMEAKAPEIIKKRTDEVLQGKIIRRRQEYKKK